MRHLALVIAIGAFAFSAHCFSEQLSLDMSSLDQWKSVTFPWAPRHSTYTAVQIDGQDVIRVQSDHSVSGIEYARTFYTYLTPIISWEWKAMNVLATGNAETRKGDDYPVRVYVMFPYQPDGLSVSQRLQFELMRGVLGYYPPSAVLNYVWANREHMRNPIRNVISNRGAMFFLDAGNEFIDTWRKHRVNVVADYRSFFHADPPVTFTLAIMGDSINTGGQTDAYVRNIKVGSEEP